MATTYTWHIDKLERTLSDGRVDVVHYHVTATDGDESVSSYGRLELTGQVATPYDQLTEQTVIGWVHSELGTAAKEARESNANATLQERLAPTRGQGVPWTVDRQPTEPRSLA